MSIHAVDQLAACHKIHCRPNVDHVRSVHALNNHRVVRLEVAYRLNVHHIRRVHVLNVHHVRPEMDYLLNVDRVRRVHVQIVQTCLARKGWLTCGWSCSTRSVGSP